MLDMFEGPAYLQHISEERMRERGVVRWPEKRSYGASEPREGLRIII